LFPDNAHAVYIAGVLTESGGDALFRVHSRSRELSNNMHILLKLTIALILAGTLLLAIAVYLGNKVRQIMPEALHRRWNLLITLIVFFLAGYVTIVIILSGGIRIPAESIMGPVFFGGALFVLIVINVSREAIGNMMRAQEELRRVNESLEQRVENRTHELKDAHAFLRTVMDSLNDGVSIIDTRDFRIVGVNAAFLRSVKRTEEEVIGRTCHEVTHLQNEVCVPPDCVCPLLETIKTGKHAVEEHIHYTGDGSKLYVEVSASPVRDKDGKIVQVVHVAKDITDRKRSEELLQRSAMELRAANEELKSFVYSVSHDLRAPLVNVKGFTAELERTLGEALELIEAFAQGLTEEKRALLHQLLRKDVPESVSFVSSSIDRMDGLISAMLKLSRFGGRELNPESVDMAALTRFLLDTFAHQIEQKHVTVKIGDLPVIVVDKMAMEQIMGNLLDNALKYLDPERSGALAVVADLTDKEMIVQVKDNGRGIAKDDIPKIFEIFRRVGRQNVPGEGMGLAYVKALVRKLGGRIWCDSEPGKGTTISFSIPCGYHKAVI
jgi:PAS domain S-box-containing protein